LGKSKWRKVSLSPNEPMRFLVGLVGFASPDAADFIGNTAISTQPAPVAVHSAFGSCRYSMGSV
jgi:hypothetical protein